MQDPSNNIFVIDQKALTDVRKDRLMHNVEPQTDEESADRTTQLYLCEIELELPVEHNQNHHIGIPRSAPQIHSNSRNPSGSTDNLFSFVPRVSSRSNKSQAPNQWTFITYAFQGQLPSNEPYEPQSFEEVMEDISKPKWEQAMKDEYLSLIYNKTWTLVTEPQNRRVLWGKWAYKLKRGPNDEIVQYKARWVVRGFEQRAGVDYHEIFASVVKPMSYKAIFAIAAALDLEIEQLDVKTTFLYGNIDEEIYVEQPKGQEDGSNRVCLLNKALYGLKQALCIWFFTLVSFLKDFGFLPLSADLAVFCHKNTYIAVYVDDILIVGPSLAQIQDIKGKLHRRFQMSDLGPCLYYLGMSVRRDRQRRILSLSQHGYIEKVLRNFGMNNAKPAITPMETSKMEVLPDGYKCSLEDRN